MDWLAHMLTRRRGVVSNVAVALTIQALTVAVAMGLAALEFSEATVVIVFVLGVLLTAVFTTMPIYCLAASVSSIICFNYFYVEPRFSLRIEGADVPGTMVVMFVVALVASYLITLARTSIRASAQASATAQNEQLRASLLRSVSHDLRTPLTAISGNADLLLDERSELGMAERRRLAQDIYNDATWLYGVVENLLTITRFEDGEVRLNREVELVDDVVETALLHVSRDAERHVISFEPAPEILLVRVDAHVLVQALVNLVNNAIGYSGEGSHIRVGVRREGDFAAVYVADDGPGIPAADKDRIFERFFTSGRAIADGRRGIGLGLPLCKTIVEAHGGRLEVADVEPHGVTFTCLLPLEEVPDYG